jgi:hypothetical protein
MADKKGQKEESDLLSKEIGFWESFKYGIREEKAILFS